MVVALFVLFFFKKNGLVGVVVVRIVFFCGNCGGGKNGCDICEGGGANNDDASEMSVLVIETRKPLISKKF